MTMKSPEDSDLQRFCVGPETVLRDVLAAVERNGEGIALVVDGDRRLVGIVTDGDVRRAILANDDFGQTVERFLGHKTAKIGSKKPLTAPVGTSGDELERLMRVRLVRHLPLLDADGRVAGLALQSRLSRDHKLPVRAVVMAGGFGTRLRPLTDDTPKPMLSVGGKPIIEHIVDQLRDAGIRRLNVATHFHPEKIRDHLGDGSRFGVALSYTQEEEPLGTAGALGLVSEVDEPLLVINGDIVTAVDFRALHDFHRETRSDLTVGVRKYDVLVPFGVIEAEDTRVTGLTEKPTFSFFINAGIYLLEPHALGLIPKGRRYDMTDLIRDLIGQGATVTRFPIHEDWIDIGQHKDLMRAVVAAERRDS